VPHLIPTHSVDLRCPLNAFEAPTGGGADPMASALPPMGPLPSSPPYPADDSSPLPAPRNASSAALAALADTGIPLDIASGFHQWAMET